VLFINSWNPTCVPCIEEMPGIEKLYSSLKNERFEFLAVTMEPRSEVSNFLTKRKLAVPVYLSNGQSLSELSAVGFPTTYLVNGDGTGVFMQSGIFELGRR
jgi:thiol-disulfide isomerase/thioredoxin